MRTRIVSLLLLSGLLVAVSTPAQSQTPAKRPITHNDYNLWRSLQSPALSPDGAYLVYSVTPQEGDGELIVRHLATGKEYRENRGSRGGPAGTGLTKGAIGKGKGAGPKTKGAGPAAGLAISSPFSPD